MGRRTFWVLAVAAGLGGQAVRGAQTVERRGTIAGSAACRECHREFHESWANSRHGASVVVADEEWARRALGPLPAKVWGGEEVLYRLEGEGGRLEVSLREEGKSVTRVPVEFALGGRDLWYLLGELDGGRLQVLPVAYDRRRGEWFNPASSAARPHAGDGVNGTDWRSPAYTFNAGCYACHVSGASGGRIGSRAGTVRWWDEPGIRCETCHGPGGEHVRVCRENKEAARIGDLKIVAASRFSPTQVEGLCGSCHAKRGVLTSGFRPGDVFADHFDLALLEDEDFTVDGRALGETYTMTSWLANRCAELGNLDCLHCHTSSGRNRFDGDVANAACGPCHDQKVSSVQTHSHHAAGEPGGRCVDCHLPMTEFARMRRHDHSFRAPTPATTLEFGTPNACNGCHQDRDAAWADAQAREWYGEDYQAPVVARARWIGRARREDWSDLEGMLGSLESEAEDRVYVASMIRLLGNCDDARKVPVLIKALSHSSPWVRASAALGLDGWLTPRGVLRLSQAAGDEFRLVRFRVAQALASLPEGVLEGSELVRVEKVWREYEAWLEAGVEDPRGMEALGHFRLDRGDPAGASEWFDRALQQHPDELPLLISAGTAHFRAGGRERAEQCFRRAAEVHPESGMAWSNWIRFLEWTGREEAAVEARQLALNRLRGLELERFRVRASRAAGH